MKNKTLLFLVLLIAAQHLFFLLYFAPLLEPDSGGYAALGRALAAGLGYDSTQRLPGYPAFLAVFYYFFGGSNLPAVIFQHLLGFAVYLTGLRLLPESRQKTIFSVLFLCDLLYASYQHAILAEALFSFLLFLSAVEFGNYGRTAKPAHLLACGALVTAGIFVKPVLKLFPLVALGLLLLANRPRFLKAAGVFLAVPLLGLGLWSWRNYVQRGAFALLPFESLHYAGRVLSHIEFPENSLSKEVFLRHMGPGPVPMKPIELRGKIINATIAELRAQGLSEEQINSEFKQVYKLSILRHPFVFAKETATEGFYFFFSAHNLYAKNALQGKLPFSVSEAFKKGDYAGLFMKVIVSLHPFYWLLFLLTVFFAASRWRDLLAGGASFEIYGLALIAYISGVTCVANEGLANYRYPLQPFMLYFSALALAAWLRAKSRAA
jgi:hypothetical protein